MSLSVDGALAEHAVAAGATVDGKIDDCPLTLINAPAAVAAIASWLESMFPAAA
jgi:hypothetical protein